MGDRDLKRVVSEIFQKTRNFSLVKSRHEGIGLH